MLETIKETTVLPITQPEPALADIIRPIRRELTQVQRSLNQRLGSRAALLREVMDYLFSGQGKYLRPALALLSARVARKHRPQVAVQVGVAVELIHTATLIHDDIIDAAVLRRNRPSINAKWGNEVSVLSGDFLYARAFRILAELTDTFFLQTMARTAEEMSRGELAEVEHRCNWRLTEAEYLDIIRGKTAALMSTSCALGAYVAAAPRQLVQTLATYGRQLGMAFQIADDCLDLVGDERVLGKTTGSDLTRGNLSLPLVYLREQLTPQEYADTFGSLELSREDAVEKLQRLSRWAGERGAIERAYDKALAFARQAKATLAQLNGCPVRGPLLQLADYAVRRTH